MQDKLRHLPKVDELLKDERLLSFRGSIPRNKMLEIVRTVIEDVRAAVLQDTAAPEKEGLYEAVILQAIRLADQSLSEQLTRVINATGIIIHTNLGRSPLSREAAEKILDITTGYCNLEYSVVTGKRRSRLYYIEKMVAEYAGAEAAIVVNNNAAAVFLVLNTLAKDGQVVLSRGEIVEIGDSFRISEIIEASGCTIKEVGTTNKTKISDYRKAINEKTSLLLKVHTSNFKVVGFTESVESKDLLALGQECDLPVVEDMGSGVFVDLTRFGHKPERQVQDAIKDGVDIITFSGDKMLGGPQAGIIVGKKKYLEPMKRNQLLRCLRVDKMCLASLSVSLSHYFQEEDISKIPSLNFIMASTEDVQQKAVALQKLLLEACPEDFQFEIDLHMSQVGGGSLPHSDIESRGIFVTSSRFSAKFIEESLRGRKPVPIICTLQNDKVILDLRTVEPSDFSYIADSFAEIGKGLM